MLSKMRELFETGDYILLYCQNDIWDIALNPWWKEIEKSYVRGCEIGISDYAEPLKLVSRKHLDNINQCFESFDFSFIESLECEAS